MAGQSDVTTVLTRFAAGRHSSVMSSTGLERNSFITAGAAHQHPGALHTTAGIPSPQILRTVYVCYLHHLHCDDDSKIKSNLSLLHGIAARRLEYYCDSTGNTQGFVSSTLWWQNEVQVTLAQLS